METKGRKVPAEEEEDLLEGIIKKSTLKTTKAGNFNCLLL